ncbi:hypothetical protein SERLADRAFT_404526 [Serpula lacrymans var. lacrymans S7.9]|uniref:Uncharacterized protein n=1 Tax=Serpula lacrymans var. lacrymans (strain S7.9) TaxID=578457 RepID=F8NDE2_SERL9|nr:uncharacterized protein SERLADRAFT_404526 [Serpula lacrymans var. lacrymans S7.9]EGO30280.1 hypothetical protein SERLADRAFT_404526 [Serpula lacrymans var. lacrymans S7.9]
MYKHSSVSEQVFAKSYLAAIDTMPKISKKKKTTNLQDGPLIPQVLLPPNTNGLNVNIGQQYKGELEGAGELNQNLFEEIQSTISTRDEDLVPFLVAALNDKLAIEDNSPGIVVSNAFGIVIPRQKSAILNWARELRAPDVLLLGAVIKSQIFIKDLVGNPTCKVTSKLGNIFYFNNVAKAIAKDYANPITCFAMQDYPEDASKGMTQFFIAAYRSNSKEPYSLGYNVKCKNTMNKPFLQHFLLFETLRISQAIMDEYGCGFTASTTEYNNEIINTAGLNANPAIFKVLQAVFEDPELLEMLAVTTFNLKLHSHYQNCKECSTPRCRSEYPSLKVYGFPVNDIDGHREQDGSLDKIWQEEDLNKEQRDLPNNGDIDAPHSQNMPAHSQAAGMAVQGDNNVSKDPAVVNVLKSERQEEKDKWKRFQAAEKYWNFVNHQLVKMWTKARNNTMNQAEHKSNLTQHVLLYVLGLLLIWLTITGNLIIFYSWIWLNTPAQRSH